MRIAVIAHQGKGGGALSVGRNLVTSLMRLAPDSRFLVTLPPAISASELPELHGENQVHVVAPRNRFEQWRFERLTLPKLVRQFRPDVLLAVGTRGLLHPPCPQAILVQRAHLFYPVSSYSRESFRNILLFKYLCWEFARTLKRTQLLLVQTQVASDRIRAWYGYQGRTVVCPNAVSRQTMVSMAHPSYPASLEKYRNKTRLLCLSLYYAHKNIEILVETFDRYRNELKDVVVVLTIRPDHHSPAERLLERIRKLRLQDLLVNVGPLPQEELAGYYTHCQGMILPTMLESFSGTYLEAMHFEVPILTSDLDFARDVCGDAAFYFDPNSSESVKNAIVSMVSNPELVQSKVRQGKERLRRYFRDWDSIASDVLRELTALVRPG